MAEPSAPAGAGAAPAWPSSLKVGMGQMLVEGGALDANLVRAERTIEEAASRSCDVVVLPEALDAGWTHPSAVDLAAPVPGPTTDRLARAAAAHRIHVVAGVTEQAGPVRYNAAVLLDDEGRLLLHVRKINVLSLAYDLYAIGDKTGVAHTRFGRIGVNICADNFPGTLHLAQTLAQMGARVVLSPSAWASDPEQPDLVGNPAREMWLEAYQGLAAGFGVPTVAVSNVGPISGGVWTGRRCIGGSLAVSGAGEILAELSADEQLVVVSVPLAPAGPAGEHP